MASAMRASQSRFTFPLHCKAITSKTRSYNSHSFFTEYPNLLPLSSPIAKPISTYRKSEIGRISNGNTAVAMGGKGINAEIYVGEDETEDSMVMRFKREVSRAGVLRECKRRRFHENTQDIKKRKAEEAARRRRRRYNFWRDSDETETETKLKPWEEFDLDAESWEWPDGDVGL